MIGLKRGTVSLRPHCAEWEEQALEMVDKLQRILGRAAAEVQHVGSTAVQELPAKPILDIAVGMRDLRQAPSFFSALSSIGVIHRPDSDGEGYLFFSRGDVLKEIRTHHIHMVRYGGERWNNYLKFRDILREDACLRGRYERLKLHLAKRFPQDRDGYTQGKAAFIQWALQRKG